MNSYSDKGDQILNAIDSTKNFTNWMYGIISPYLRGDILEVGSGVGTYSGKLTQDNRFSRSSITLSDIDNRYVEKLAREYDGFPNVDVCKIDITNGEKVRSFESRFDSIFALNVLEHVERDGLALKNLHMMLNEDGNLVLILPNYKWLFNSLDKAVNHFRRYNKRDISEKIQNTDFEIVELKYFNSVGVMGWFLNGNILKKDVIDEQAGISLILYDKIIPIWKYFEELIFSKILGLSLLVVLKKVNI